MNSSDIAARLGDIQATGDLLEKAMKLAGLVSRVFGDAGWDLVVVGGSAVEFYTEGAYMSGDIDFCRRRPERIPLRMAQDLMAGLGATGGPRSWKIAGLFVDLLGVLESEAQTPCRTLETSCGPISIIPPEQVVVERVLLAFYPSRDAEARAVAKKMLAVCISGRTPIEWKETERLAGLPTFNITKELAVLVKEVRDELGTGS